MKTSRLTLGDCITSFSAMHIKQDKLDEIFKGDYEADNMIKHVSGNESQWAYQKAKVPASSDSWDYELYPPGEFNVGQYRPVIHE